MIEEVQQKAGLMTAYVSPTNDVERKIAEIWQELLGVEQIGINDDFFAVGGNSLLGTQLMILLRQTFHVDPPLLILFEAPTIAKLALVIEGLIIQEIDAMN